MRFGTPRKYPRTRRLVAGIIAGIGAYGNSFGRADRRRIEEFRRELRRQYSGQRDGGGHRQHEQDGYAKASEIGNKIVYLGSKTGRDEIHGATMASAAFEADAEEKRPTVQVGDPFTEKLLLEACLELMQTGAVIAIQDMGAAGLTSSAVEMGAKGNLGIALDLDRCLAARPACPLMKCCCRKARSGC